MKTAVEWLIEKHFGSIENCSPNFRKHIEQANKMFEEQIIDAFCEDKYEYRGYRQITLSGKDYYNETFKSE